MATYALFMGLMFLYGVACASVVAAAWLWREFE